MAFGRKSTGGVSDLVAEMGSQSATINPMPTSPSISMKDNSIWYFNPATDSKESDSSRGLSTAESAKIKKQKHQVTLVYGHNRTSLQF